MKPSDLTLALNAAVVHLQWLNADRYRGALKLVKQVPVDLEAIGSSSGGDLETRDRRQIGGHSDPTGDAVASSADRQARLTDRADTICTTARNLRIWMAVTPMPAASGSLAAAEADLAWCAALAGVWRPVTDDARHRVLNAAQTLYDEAAALQCEVEQALRYSATVAAGRPKPKPLRLCKCCEPMGYHEPALPTSDLCEVCKAFQMEHKCWPTKSIRDDRAMGRKRVRPGQLAEAKAARKVASRQRRTA